MQPAPAQSRPEPVQRGQHRGDRVRLPGVGEHGDGRVVVHPDGDRPGPGQRVDQHGVRRARRVRGAVGPQHEYDERAVRFHPGLPQPDPRLWPVTLTGGDPGQRVVGDRPGHRDALPPPGPVERGDRRQLPDGVDRLGPRAAGIVAGGRLRRHQPALRARRARRGRDEQVPSGGDREPSGGEEGRDDGVPVVVGQWGTGEQPAAGRQDPAGQAGTRGHRAGQLGERRTARERVEQAPVPPERVCEPVAAGRGQRADDRLRDRSERHVDRYRDQHEAVPAAGVDDVVRDLLEHRLARDERGRPGPRDSRDEPLGIGRRPPPHQAGHDQLASAEVARRVRQVRRVDPAHRTVQIRRGAVQHAQPQLTAVHQLGEQHWRNLQPSGQGTATIRHGGAFYP